MNDSIYLIIVIVLMALVTVLLRALPFVASRWIRHQPFVRRLGASLPLAIMVLLTLDTAAAHARSHPGLPWPEVVAIALVLFVQARWRQPLLSIVLGTASYMIMRLLPGFV